MKVAVLGWAVDTQDCIPYLLEKGGEITVYDKNANIDKGVWADKFAWVLGKEQFEGLEKFDLIVRTPGIYRHRPELLAAEQAGVKITSKTKIFFDICPCPIIGVTGTKGKGTTSTLIYEMLKQAGKDVYLAGNIGKGMFENLFKLTKDSWMILELSSFQLIDLHKSPHISVVLMTTSDHLDWHVDVDEYVNAKSQITKHQTSNDFVVYNKDYPNSVKIGLQGSGQKLAVSREDWTWPKRLRGDHNKENFAAAAAVAKIVGISEDIVKQVALDFKGLEHRLEEVETVDGVTYFDDSISTVPETTIAAIQAFSEPVVLIVGGSEKGSDFTHLGQIISDTKNIRAVILIGLMADRIEGAISNKAIKLIKGLKTMPEIIKVASEIAQPGDVVVLSPGAASFDMFKNYKDRGDQFKTCVRALRDI